ncbi:hypothetical protein SDC9_101568 [bioreactor metagenome]|uniref:Uncharacterized protein n=1 Tax=bioreactor metagenome TaxID=1076179 RepID=A0A645APU9_9ZZZZ
MLSLAVQPKLFVTSTVRYSLAAGRNAMLSVVNPFSQKYETPPLTPRYMESFRHTDESPVNEITGKGFTFTTKVSRSTQPQRWVAVTIYDVSAVMV